MKTSYRKIRRINEPVNLPKNETLTLTIETNEAWDFFAIFDGLGECQQKIWKMLVWWTRTFPNAFPSQEKIAKKCGCTRKHVNRTIAEFKKFGWISLNSRGVRRTKSICIPKGLSKIDHSNRQCFMKDEVSSKVSHICSIYPKETSKVTSVSLGEILVIPDHLKKLKDLPLDVKLKLSLLPENLYHNALQSARYQYDRGNLGRNDTPRLQNYVVQTAFIMAEKASIRPNWKLYYKTLESMRGAA